MESDGGNLRQIWFRNGNFMMIIGYELDLLIVSWLSFIEYLIKNPL